MSEDNLHCADRESKLGAELADAAATLGLRLTTAELSAFASEAAAVLERAIVEVPTTTVAPNDSSVRSWRPNRSEDPLNAFLLRCTLRHDVSGAAEGLRVAVKANIAVRGLELSCGSAVLRGFRPADNALVIERLLAAGAQIVGITNMDDLGSSGDGTTSASGAVVNPFDRRRSAGGSSAGSAAALHYDFVDAALGTDQGGSIRIPASWCGVLGLKPTFGAIPYTRIVGLDRSVDHVGPLGGDVCTLARVFAVIAGPSATDARTRGVDRLGRSPEPMRRLALLREGFAASQHDVHDALEPAIDDLRSSGLTVDEISISEHTKVLAIAAAIGLEGTAAVLASGGSSYGWSGESWPELAAALRKGLAERGHLLAPHVKLTIALGTLLQRRFGGAFYASAQRSRLTLTAAYEDALTRYDALLMPTTPFPAQPILERASLREKLRAGWSISVNTHAANLTGHPALSLPVAAVDGLPVGLMAVTAKGADWRLIDFARQLEDRRGWTPPSSSVSGSGGNEIRASRR